MKFLIAIPLVLSSAAFICSLLALLSGYKQGFMEDYNLLTLNTSALGQQAIQRIASGESPTSTSGGGGGEIGSIIASATALLPASVASEASSIVQEIGSNVADQLADELGISEFYSIHAMDFCEGQFAPNATATGAYHNVTNCTAPLDFAAYNFTDKLNKQLSVGPLQFTLADLGVGQDVQDKLDMLPKIARALAGVFIVSTGFAGLSMLGSALGFLLIPRLGRTLSLLNWLLALLSAVFLLASALVATIGPREVTDQLEQNGADAVGLEIISNTKLQRITWAAFALMALTAFYWFYELIVECVRRKRTKGYSEKTTSFGK